MKTTGILTGLGVGAAVMGAVALSSNMMSKSSRRATKRKAMRAMKSMETLMGDITYMFK